MTEDRRQKWTLFLISAGLVLATLVAYEPIRHNDLVNYDDDRYIIDNPNVHKGITRESITWAFTRSYSANWHPLTWLSHILDCQLFGPNPIGHHFVSVVFHIINALLLFWILSNITGSTWASAFVAGVFALHPLQVDSIAWAAERKTVLSGLFWLLTMAVYIWYTKKPGIGRYTLVFGTYVLCIMTKPVVVTLPFVLLLIDYWPLNRLPIDDRRLPIKNRKSETDNWKWAIIEKIPLFVLSAILSMITVVTQRSGQAMTSLESIPLDARVANIFISYIKYIYKTATPSKLAVFYPHTRTGFDNTSVVICGLLFVIITFFSISIGRQRKYIATGWLWFVGTLVPMIGLIQVGTQSMANRYMYIPMLGLLIIVGWSAKDIVSDNRRRRVIAAALAAIVLAASVILTRIQVKHWQNNITLFKYTLDVTEKNVIAEGNYGCSLLDAGYLQEAETHLRNACIMNPNDPTNRYNLGRDLLEQGKNNEAILHFSSISSGPDEFMAHVYKSLGTAYLRLSKYEPAKENLTKAMKLQPNNLVILNNLAWVLATADNTSVEDAKEAIKLAERVCELTKHKDPDLLDTLAAAYAAGGRFDEAVITTQKAIEAAKTVGQKDLIIELQEQIKLYQSGQRYRQIRMSEDGGQKTEMNVQH